MSHRTHACLSGLHSFVGHALVGIGLLVVAICFPATAQAKITVTGAAADKTTLEQKLSTCTNGTVTIAGDGTMSIAGAGINACGQLVKDMIDDAGTSITIDVVHGVDSVFVGAFQPPIPPNDPTTTVSNGTQIIDIKDICEMPVKIKGKNVGSPWSGMIHELYEAYYSKKFNKPYKDAHTLGIDKENVSLGLENRALRDGGTPPPQVPAKPPAKTSKGGWLIFIPVYFPERGYTCIDLEGYPTAFPYSARIQFGFLGPEVLGSNSIPVPENPVTGEPLNDVYIESATFVPLNEEHPTPPKFTEFSDLVACDTRTLVTSAGAGTTVLASYTFESGVSCALQGWVTVDLTGGLYGNYAALFPGTSQVQQDPCARDLSCMWAAISGSTETYACGGFPAQAAVPKANISDEYLHNEIWSPMIPLAGSGSTLTLKFSVYRDLRLDGLVFYTWRVRDVVGLVPGPWQDRGLVYYGSQKDWAVHTESVGDLIRLGVATHAQIALGVRDMCAVWCGIYGTGACHSHSPLFDSVKLYRVNTSGPQWSVRDIDQFQDNFAGDGTITGTVRADAAIDILSDGSPGIQPGDSAVVRVDDPVAGIATDPVGGPAVYIYVAVWPQGQLGKSGSALTQDSGRWPYVGSSVVGGTTWSCIRLDSTRVYGKATGGAYCVDLNDNLFVPGDTVCFFYCAQNALGERTYASCSTLKLQGSDLNWAAANPAEFTCLPAGGWLHGGDILYVDAMDGRGDQQYFETAFQSMGLLDYVDRYDVRGPTSFVGNHLGSRVTNVTDQLVGCYRKILMDFGTITPNDRVLQGEFELINIFLNSRPNVGGVYLCGDDLPSALSASPWPGPIGFRSTYMTYTMTSPNHVATGYGTSPLARGVSGNCFNGDTFFTFGGCPKLNDFDVMTPTVTSKMEVSYGVPAANNGAVLSKVTNNGSANVGVLLSGFSFVNVSDDENDGISDRADHMYDILTWLGNLVAQPTGTTNELHTSLDQNYPNPFNPTTTISFFLKANSDVRLEVFDARGALVRTLVHEPKVTGSHRVTWDGKDNAGAPTASGVYFYRLVAGDFTSTRKMVLLK